MDKQIELKALLCDKFLLLENLQATANQTTSEIRRIKQLITIEMNKPVKKPEVKKDSKSK